VRVVRDTQGSALNEYTRREEIRWTIVSVFILVPAVAIAIVRLVLAQGPMVTNPEAIKAESDAKALVESHKGCVKAADKLNDEVAIFRDRVKAAQDEVKKKEEERKRQPRFPVRPADNVPIEPKYPWATADTVLRHVRALDTQGCRKTTEDAVGKDDDAAAGWKAIAKAAKTKAPGNEKEQQAAARSLVAALEGASFDKVKAHTLRAEKQLAEALEKATARTQTDKLRAALPQGLFPRGAAIGVGVGVALAALIISYISVRSASVRRGRTLIALRRFANTPEAGLQAAAIVRLAAHHNGGEPGMVIGSALGGLLAALASPTDNPNIFIADLFVAGSMGGLLIGLAAQWLVRTLTGVQRWRERTKELGDIEKPTIPVALVLGGVTPGLEKQFLRYFEALPVADAATVVQKLAAQAEEQILAAADAAAAQQPQYPGAAPHPQHPGQQGPWGYMGGPGGMPR
jgi:hypothetical protein